MKDPKGAAKPRKSTKAKKSRGASGMFSISGLDSPVEADGTAHQRTINGSAFQYYYEAAVLKYVETDPPKDTSLKPVRDDAFPITQPTAEDVTDKTFLISITVPVGTPTGTRDVGMYDGDTLVGTGVDVLVIKQPQA